MVQAFLSDHSDSWQDMGGEAISAVLKSVILREAATKSAIKTTKVTNSQGSPALAFTEK